MAPPLPNFLLSLLVPALLSSLFSNKSRFFFSKRRTFLNLKFPDPGSKRGFWHTALEDWDHEYHSQSHGVCALQVSAGVFNVHCTSGGNEVDWDLVCGDWRLWMVDLENEDKVQIKNLDLQPAPLLFVGSRLCLCL